MVTIKLQVGKGFRLVITVSAAVVALLLALLV